MTYGGQTTHFGWEDETHVNRGRRTWQGAGQDTLPPVVRHNLVSHPSFELDGNSDGLADGWQPNEEIAGTATYSLVSGGLDGQAQRIQYTGAAGDTDDSGVGIYFTSAAGSFAAGDIITASTFLKGSLSGCAAQIWLAPANASGTVLSWDYYCDGPTITSSWARFASAVCLSAPADTDHVIVWIWIKDIAEGDTVDISIDDVLLEKGTTGAYFDGSSTGATWDGTAEASTSTVSQAAAEMRHNLTRNPSFESDVDDDSLADGVVKWGGLAGSPGYELAAGRSPGLCQRITYTGIAGDSDAASGWTINDGNVPVSELEPLRVSAYLKGSGNGMTVRLAIIYYDVNDDWLDTCDETLTLTSTWTPYSVCALAPSGAVSATTAVRVSHVDNGESLDLYIDDVLVEKTTAANDYFDGDYPDAAWDGTPDGSSSTLDVTGHSIQYEYAANGRMTKYSDGAAHIKGEYAYDAAGQRTRSTVTDSGATTATDYTYDGLTLLSLTGVVGADRHNLFKNPGFEADSDADGCADGIGDWGSIAGTPAYTRPASSLGGLAQNVAYTATGSDAGADYECCLAWSDAGTVMPGEPLRASVYLKGTLGAGQTARLYLVYHDAEDDWLAHDSKTITIGDTWQRVNIGRLVAPANASYAFLTVNIDDIDSGEAFEISLDDLMLEQSATMGSYFDGDSDGASWDGEANASTSTLTAAASVDRHNLLPNPSFELDSDSDGLAESVAISGSYAGTAVNTLVGGAHGGDYAQRVQYTGVSADDNTTFEPQVTLSDGSFAAGDDYRFSLYVKGTLAGTGTPYVGVVAYDANHDIVDDTYAAISGLSGSWQRYSVSGTCVEGTSLVRCYVWFDGVDEGDTVDLCLDDALLEKTVSLRAYFDGDSTGASWDGTPDASTSTMEAATAAEHESWQIDYLYDEEGTPYGGVYRSPSSSHDGTYFSMITTDRGDVVELLDRDGDAFAAYRYDEWGNPLGSVSEPSGIWTQGTSLIDAATAGEIADRQILRYAGYAYDAESGLYYCSARYYDPVTRQWTTKDEVKADGEESAYQYCGGEPVAHRDPTGARKWKTAIQKVSWRSPKTGNGMVVKFWWKYDGVCVKWAQVTGVWPLESANARRVGWRWRGLAERIWSDSRASYASFAIHVRYHMRGIQVPAFELVGFIPFTDIPIIIPTTMRYTYDEDLYLQATAQRDGRLGSIRHRHRMVTRVS